MATATQGIGNDSSGRLLMEKWIVESPGHAGVGSPIGNQFADPKGPKASAEIWRFFGEANLDSSVPCGYATVRKTERGERMNIGSLLPRHAQYRPHHTALIFEDRRLTFLELNRRVNQLANALLSLGVKKNDKVATILPNGIELLESYWAIVKIGAGDCSAQSIAARQGTAKPAPRFRHFHSHYKPPASSEN